VISGEVVESGTGEPVAGVWVHLYAASVDYLVTTEHDGTFRLRCPPEGYGVRPLRAPGGYSNPDGSEVHSVTVRDGEDVSVRRFEIPKGLIFVGRVVDPQGKPVSTARVLIPKRGSSSAVTTDAQGRFRLRDLEPNSRHAISAQCTKTGLSAGAVIEVPARSPDELVIKLLPRATVVGRIVDPEGNPVQGHPVSSSDMLGEFCVGGKSRASGEDGRYRLSATAGTRVCVRASAQQNGAEHPAIVVVAGEHYEMPDIIVRPLHTIAGRVVDPYGEPVPEARVRMRFGHQPFDTVTDAQGAFKFEKVEQRGDHVRFSASDAEGTLAGQAEIEARRASDDIVLQLVRAASVAGRMVEADGKPIPGALASVFVVVQTRDIWSTVVARARADAQGRYCIRGLVPHPRGFVTGSAQGYASADSRERALVAGKTVEIEDLVLRRADSFVAGTVTDLDGKPLVGVHVSCSHSSQGSGLTNSQGKYRYDGVPRVDDVRISVHHAGYHSDRRFFVKAGSADVNFKLTPKSQATPGAVATVGKPAPEPTVDTWLNSTALKLSALRGKVVAVHFWTLHSRPCISSMHTLLTLHEQYPNDLAIVAIHDRAATAKEVREFAEENQVKFPVGIVKSTKDDGWAGKTFRAFGVKSLPATFLVDKKGILRKTNVTDDLAAQVKALMAE